MEIMEMDRKQWETKMGDLWCEINASKEAYIALSGQHKYPQKEPFFSQQAAQRMDFEKIFGDELTTVKEGGIIKDCKDKEFIFDPVTGILANDNLSDVAIDRLILQKELELIGKYQEVLSYPYIPDATAAILQAEVEDMNNMVLKLRIDLNLEEKVYGK